MQTCSVCSHEYDVDLGSLLLTQLNRTEADYRVIEASNNSLIADTATDERFNGFCSAVCELIVSDLACFELSSHVKHLAATDEESKRVLALAIRYSRTAVPRTPILRGLKEHYTESTSLVIEGFMRFRMKDSARIWERCVDKAAEEIMLEAERNELMSLLGTFVSMQQPKIRELIVIMKPDGGCTITDDSDTHIDYPKEATDAAVSLLVSLSPERVIAYDMSDGTCAELLVTILRLFEGRVRVYRTRQI